MKLSVTSLLLAMLEGFDYAPMKNASPTAAPIFTFFWTVLSGLILVNMFIAILSHSYSYIQKRTKRQDEAERLFEMPTWMLYIRSKIPCMRLKDVDMAERVMKMKREAAEVKELLAQLDHEKLWKHALMLVAEDQLDIDVRALMEYFPHANQDESYRRTVEWMEAFADANAIKLRRTDREFMSLSEIRLLTERVTSLDQEMAGLMSQLLKAGLAKSGPLASPV